MTQQPSSVPRRRGLPAFFLAMLSGVYLGGAFPPIDWKWLVWVGLVPLLHAVIRAPRARAAFGDGYLAGLVFFLMNLHPLVSVHSWTGWATESPDAFALRMNRQWWFMQGIWVAFAVWCAVWWGVWAVVVRRAAARGTWRVLLAAPSAWIVWPELARSTTTFGFAWGLLGNATADCPAIRQLASVGGVWLLSAIVVLFNVGVVVALERSWGAQRWKACAACAAVFASAWGAGQWRLSQQHPASPQAAVTVAVLQRAKPSYDAADFTATGFDRSYGPMIQQALRDGAQLLVLPESIALGTLSLDGTPSHTKPTEWQHERAAWDRQMADALRGTPATLVLGLDTVEQGQDHNTLVAWNAGGALGWYHKRRLVPFSEYEPWAWAPWAIRGTSQYDAGRSSQLIRAPHGLVVGGFICQEVLFPSLTRASVRDGATVLVSGGNDGVFGDPVVAQVHADAAQIRAVETGRYLARAMKTGISAVIDPQGRELARSPSADPILLSATIAPLRQLTPYVRFGDWCVWLAAALMVAVLL